MLSHVSAAKKYVHLLLLTLICYLWMKYGTFFLPIFQVKPGLVSFSMIFFVHLSLKKNLLL